MSGPAPLLDDMVLFTEVVDAGGITAGAARLGVRKSTVSRRLTALEERLGTRLLERTTRRLALTEAGRAYHAECARLVAEARALNRALSEQRDTPHGTLRVATLALLGEVLAPVFAEYLLLHPQVRMEVALAQGPVDLVAEAYDVALRTGPLADSALVARKLGLMRTGYFASPAYLSRRGTPRTPDDVREHECIVTTESGTDEVWFFSGPSGPRTLPAQGRLRLPSLRAGHAAARAGLGLVRLPHHLVTDDLRQGVLVPVLEPVTPPGIPVFAVYPSARQVPSKVRAFLDLLAQRGTSLPWEDVPAPPASRKGASGRRER